ncbi:MAG: hypothetical protein N2712_06535 [Brevinematales bacterium]|nr:hypothetical protein [Brevinematales bacterium]
MKKLLILAMFFLSINGYCKINKENAFYILRNHKEKGFFFEGEASKDTLKVVIDFKTNSEKVFINFSEDRLMNIITFYSTVMVLDKKPSHGFMEYLLRANNFNKSLGFFYIYYDINLDKWFIDYSVRIREEDITKSSLIEITKIVALYSLSSRKKISEMNLE